MKDNGTESKYSVASGTTLTFPDTSFQEDFPFSASYYCKNFIFGTKCIFMLLLNFNQKIISYDIMLSTNNKLILLF